MRAIDCDCGDHLEARDEEALVDAIRTHAATAHPDLALTDDQVRELATSRGYETAAA
jgi:predicted small metal-binding protein